MFESLLAKINAIIKNPRRLLIHLLHKVGIIFSDTTYLKLYYRVQMGRGLDLTNPQTYNEKLQWLKLNYRKPEFTKIVDKVYFKEHIINTIGAQYIIPTLGVWDYFEDIDFEQLPNQFVLKCSHDSGGLVICRDKGTFNYHKAKRKINRHLKNNHFNIGREWPYKDIKPRIIAEQYMANKNFDPDIDINGLKSIDAETLQNKFGLLDYKFMCFNGEVKALFLDIGVTSKSDGHAENYYRSIYNANWEAMDFKETRDHFPIPIEKPHFFDDMVKIAQKLSANYPHIRVDLYYINGQIYAGELTFFHGSGLDNCFIPNEWDYKFGEWIKLPD